MTDTRNEKFLDAFVDELQSMSYSEALEGEDAKKLVEIGDRLLAAAREEAKKMTDTRELLELAAYAVGIEGWKDAGSDYAMGIWNPAEDDGDSIRMCDALLIDIDWLGRGTPPDGLTVMTWAFGEAEEYVKRHNNDRGAARRMAVLRVAAEIGRRKKAGT